MLMAQLQDRERPRPGLGADVQDGQVSSAGAGGSVRCAGEGKATLQRGVRLSCVSVQAVPLPKTL